jgi:hypothetical protein
VQVEAGTDISYPPDTLSSLYDTAKTLSDAANNRELTSDEQRVVLKGAATQLLNPISANAHIGIGVGVYENTEVQARWFSGGWRLGARYQFLSKKDDGIDLSLGLGFGRYSYSFGVPDIVDILSIDDYRRFMVDVPLLLGSSGTWYRWWGGPKMVLGTYHAGARLQIPSTDELYGFELNGVSRYLGGQLGGALGYKWIFFAMELTVVHFSTTAKFEAVGASTSSYDAKIDGTIIYPGLGLMGEF